MVTDSKGRLHEPKGIPTGGQYAGGNTGHGVTDDLPPVPGTMGAVPEGVDLIPDGWSPRDYGEAERHLEAVRDRLTMMSEENKRTRAIAPYEQCVQVNEYGDYVTMEQFERAFPTDLAKARYKAWENQYEYSHWFEEMYMDSLDDPARLDQLEKSSELWDSDSNEGCYETECTWGDDGDYWLEDKGGENPRTALFEKGSAPDIEAKYPGSEEIRIQGENIIGKAIKNRPDLIGREDKRYWGNRMSWKSTKLKGRTVLLEYARSRGFFKVTTKGATVPGEDPTDETTIYRADDHNGDLRQALAAASENMVGRLTTDVW